MHAQLRRRRESPVKSLKLLPPDVPQPDSPENRKDVVLADAHIVLVGERSFCSRRSREASVSRDTRPG